VFWVELITGACFGLLFWKYGLTWDYAIISFFVCVFLVLLVIDLEHKLILNVIIYPMLPVALLISSLYPQPSMSHFTGALIGGAAGFLIFLLIFILSRGGMGMGDVKMAAFIGLAAGIPDIFTAIMLAILTGGIIAIILLLFKLKKRKEGIPFGPFLAIGAVATLMYGKPILDWYMNLLNFGL